MTRAYRTSLGVIESVIGRGESLTIDQLEARRAELDTIKPGKLTIKRRQPSEADVLKVTLGKLHDAVHAVAEQRRQEALAELFAAVERSVQSPSRKPSEPDALELHILGADA